jgi:hypothetical protein
MNGRIFLIACLSLPAVAAWAQQEQGAFGITFSGFVKTDVMYDSRQTVAAREGHFLLYPAPVVNDKANTDINAKANFNILSIQTRLTGKISGPDALGVKTAGVIEGEFFGTSDADVSGFRIRHAFVKLDWPSASLLIGQFWHPMFVVEMFPGVISFNTGAPFQAFSRNPQIRFSVSSGPLKFIAAALAQRDFASNGPTGVSTSYMRNAAVPGLHAQVQYVDGPALAGIGFDYKQLVPRLATTKNIATDATVGSTAILGYGRVTIDPVTVKAEVTYGGNLADLLMLGGYAVASIDTATGVERYAALKSFSVWGEIASGKELELALFAAYARTLGAAEKLAGPFYGRATDVDNLLRIAPRVAWNTGKLRLAAEVEYTSAAYGTPNGANNGRVENTRTAANLRVLAAVFYFF